MANTKVDFPSLYNKDVMINLLTAPNNLLIQDFAKLYEKHFHKGDAGQYTQQELDQRKLHKSSMLHIIRTLININGLQVSNNGTDYDLLEIVSYVLSILKRGINERDLDEKFSDIMSMSQLQRGILSR